jgi:hypothetical protein
VTPNVPFDVVVTVRDAFGNLDVNYRGTVSFSATDLGPEVVLPGAYTFTEADGGMHTFTGAFALVTSGPQVLTVREADGDFSADVTVTVLDGEVIISPPQLNANA